MKATIDAMRTYYPRYGEALVLIGYDGCEYSANPDDYFWANPELEVEGELLVKHPPTYTEPE